ncbi:MAG: flagellar hook protein FlgE [Gammaproteobacteria bacterium]|nr:flagellar hook protein FlgE [Gammaproteobacteria bacterium]
MTFEIALTGINAASAELDVISNNIANNATTGFKRSEAEFADMYASSTLGLSNTATGSGVRVASIAQQFSQGDISYTDNNLDLSISGEGFFRMNDNGSIVYTRSGVFSLDAEGYLVNSAGHYLTGYPADTDGNISSAISSLRLDPGDLSPQATSEMELGINLDTMSEVLDPFDVNDPNTFNYSTTTTIYDSQGSAHDASIYYHMDAPNEWSSYIYVNDVEVSQAGGNQLVFNEDGTLASVNGNPETLITTNSFTPVDGTAAQTISLDFASTTQYDNPFGINHITQNGYSTGSLEDIEIDGNGIIYGRYNNQESKPLGQISLTNFANPQGLRPVGETGWAETFSSGVAATGTPGSASLGLLQSGSLEESNVDITEELVAMIGAQRSFQANAQVISTADTLTQTVINIRR